MRRPRRAARSLLKLFAMVAGSTYGVAECEAQSRQTAIAEQVSYTNDIRPVVKNFCVTCHAGENPEGEFTLTSYEDVRKHTEKGQLIARINDAEDPMPQSGLMPRHLRRLFKTWADQGYVNQGKASASQPTEDYADFVPPTIIPIDIRSNPTGFQLLEKMQGHWVGSMNLMGQDFDWMALDYRAIAPSHIHGIFEGGTIGNLFTSFFVTNFNGKRTIMARNGGLLNGIYRTSYFVLDHVEQQRGATYYRLVDAYAGESVMWMELTFYGDTLEFNAYTSRFGMVSPPKRHMTFKAKRKHPELARAAAQAVGFPKDVVDYDFASGLPTPDWGEYGKHTSATYMWDEEGMDLLQLAHRSKDPYRIDQIPHLAQLDVEISRTPKIAEKKLHLYLSSEPLARPSGEFITRYGYIREELLDTLLLFPEISGSQDEFTFTYLHPGTYYLTVIADMDDDGFPSPGDISHPLRKVLVKPESQQSIRISDLTVQN